MDPTTPPDPPTTGEPVCYRHPDRVTYLSCSECGKAICGDCSLDSAVGQKCADCARHTGRGRVVTARNMTQYTPVVMTIIAITVVAYFIQRSDPQFTIDYALITSAVRDGEWWRGITSAFLHADTLLHIGFNMYLLYALGPRIERQVGPVAFSGLYLASAIAGSVFFQYLAEGGAVGASGAVYGLFGAVLVGTYPVRHTAHGSAQFRQLLILVGINLMLSFAIPSIAWEAHVGGLIAGAGIVLGWQRIPTTVANAPALRSVMAWSVALLGLAFLIVA